MSVVANSAVAKLTTAPMHRRERRPTSMTGFAMLEGNESHEILVLDLSYEGCGIQTPVELRPGQKLKLSVLRRGAIDAEVRWCSGGKAGLVFAEEAAPAEEHRARIAERVTLTAEVRMRRLGKANYRVAVLDASPQGCRVELVEQPSTGEHVLVKFDGLEVLGSEVCWVEQRCAGLRFEKPIHPAVFELMIKRLRIKQ